MNEQKGTIRRAVPIEWHIPEGMIPQYATSTVVQRGENEIFISFFHVIPPLLIGTPEEIADQADKINSVRAECVARVVIAPNQLHELIEALKTQEEHLSQSDDHITRIEQ